MMDGENLAPAAVGQATSTTTSPILCHLQQHHHHHHSPRTSPLSNSHRGGGGRPTTRAFERLTSFRPAAGAALSSTLSSIRGSTGTTLTPEQEVFQSKIRILTKNPVLFQEFKEHAASSEQGGGVYSKEGTRMLLHDFLDNCLRIPELREDLSRVDMNENHYDGDVTTTTTSSSSAAFHNNNTTSPTQQLHQQARSRGRALFSYLADASTLSSSSSSSSSSHQPSTESHHFDDDNTTTPKGSPVVQKPLTRSLSPESVGTDATCSSTTEEEDTSSSDRGSESNDDDDEPAPKDTQEVHTATATITEEEKDTPNEEEEDDGLTTASF